MSTPISLKGEVTEQLSGSRLDQAAAKLFPEYSRARLQNWIKDGSLLVNGQLLRPKDRVHTEDRLAIEAELSATETWVPQPMELDIVFEDEHLLVINKSANLVVHPAAGHRDGTLLNGLLHHHTALAELPRAGIVHRLDKDTTGLMVVAKTLVAHTELVNQLQARTMSRQYQAVVHGVLTGGGTVDRALGRHPVNRKKRAIVELGQEAVTHYRVRQRFRSHTLLDVRLETGRTHQIRAHMAYLNHAIVGDPMYGGRLQLPAACSQQLADCLRQFKRQALHACKLALSHPVGEVALSWEVDCHADMNTLIKRLNNDARLIDTNS